MFQTFPSESNFENWEVFNHEIYLKNTEDKKKEIRRATCLARYNIEKEKILMDGKLFFIKFKS